MKIYKKYKRVDLPWLKEVPEHWELKKAKHLFNREKRAVKKNDEIITCFRDGIVTLRKNRRLEGYTEAINEYGYQRIKKGDLVIHVMDAFAGAIGVSDSDGKSTPVYIVCTAKVDLNNYYYKYLLRYMAYTGYIKSLYRGIRERSTNFTFDIFKEILLPIPPLSEQNQIANFLDWKIGEIDRLVGLEKRKVERLGELYRKILNNIFDNISGEKKRLKYIFSFGKGLGITKENLGEYGYRCINYGEIHGKLKFSFSSKDKLLKGLSNVEGITITEFANLSKGDFIFADTSEDLIGSGNFTFLECLDSEVYAGYHTIVCKPKIKFNSRFLAYQLESDLWRTQIRKAVNGIKVYSITQQILKQTSVVFPDLSIQENIVSKLDGIQDKLIDMKRCTETQITYLEELKKSLISDVVTGKMDVREIEIPEEYRRD
ncbi:restriction endonuclease subunit S [Gemella sp. zg-1178]|uniref:restriction endonuclease subunit S n=1 Tax=Gemella sp. zg-1178 TaxID=2840372 RepID=UPI001C05ECA2|nr:restriction endonuclease subunit S [Gemella sp. zg-1178]MBU0278864.1 restriction endonuclease subunit S [Gemella sp. zg-1178]